MIIKIKDKPAMPALIQREFCRKKALRCYKTSTKMYRVLWKNMIVL